MSGANWAWGLSLIALTIIIHVTGIVIYALLDLLSRLLLRRWHESAIETEDE